jgi:hypothetical protein
LFLLLIDYAVMSFCLASARFLRSSFWIWILRTTTTIAKMTAIITNQPTMPHGAKAEQLAPLAFATVAERLPPVDVELFVELDVLIADELFDEEFEDEFEDEVFVLALAVAIIEPPFVTKLRTRPLHVPVLL